MSLPEPVDAFDDLTTALTSLASADIGQTTYQDSTAETGTHYFQALRITAMCEELHMANTGSSDSLTPERRAELRARLQERLKNWTPSPVAEWAPYDDAIRYLIIATLEEPNWIYR